MSRKRAYIPETPEFFYMPSRSIPRLTLSQTGPRRPQFPSQFSVGSRRTGGYASTVRRGRGARNRTMRDHRIAKMTRKSYRGPLTKKVIKKKLTKMCHFMKQQEATHTRRERYTGSVKSLTNTRTYGNVCFNLGTLQGAMNALRFYDTATDTMKTIDLANGTYNRDVNVSIYRKLTVRNNYHVPCVVSVYSCTPRDSTNNLLLSAFTGGLADQNNPASNSDLMTLKDSDDVKKIWSIKTMFSGVLRAGRQKTFANSVRRFLFDISKNQFDTNQYQKKQGGHCWIISVSGVVGHDSVVGTQQGHIDSGVDYSATATIKIHYDAGKDLNDFSLVDGATAFTNVGRITNQPLAAQQNYQIT